MKARECLQVRSELSSGGRAQQAARLAMQLRSRLDRCTSLYHAAHHSPTSINWPTDLGEAARVSERKPAAPLASRRPSGGLHAGCEMTKFDGEAVGVRAKAKGYGGKEMKKVRCFHSLAARLRNV